MSFYTALPEPVTEMQQGDLLTDLPFGHFPLTGVKVQLSSGEITTCDLISNRQTIEFITAKVEFGWGMVLSQTCDIQLDSKTGFARRPILVARVRPIKALVAAFNDNSSKSARDSVDKLATAGKSPTLLYLPAHQNENVDFPRSGAYLLDVQRFYGDELFPLLKQVRLRISDAALQALQERCAYCFGRFAAPDGLYYSEEEKRKESGI